ncbi:MAG: hypothetical protein K2X87_20960 [Gemmataceae bacterium]|nr:hypothetical protein [Gemmataceae bacterium]
MIPHVVLATAAVLGAPAPAGKPTPIDLAGVYVTGHQEGFKRVDVGELDLPKELVEALYNRSAQTGMSNAFLVRGDSVQEAVRATRATFDTLAGAGRPYTSTHRPSDEALWLVAYLGLSGSDPPAFRVRAAEVDKDRRAVRLTYSYARAFSDDVHPYYAWVPLGRLPGGAYTLELYDADDRAVTLTRRVQVAGKK